LYVGNLKYYSQSNQTIDGLIKPLSSRQHFALISSHHDEELRIAEIIVNTLPDMLFIIIPRHIERAKSLEKTLKDEGYTVSVRSKNEAFNDDTQIYLADTMGEVSGLIVDASVCIIGGSFIDHGGQNLLEPARLSKAIICGPYMYNFADIFNQFDSKQAVISTDYNNLAATLKEIINNPSLKKGLEENAQALSSNYKKIVDSYMAKLL